MALAVANLHADHHAVERREGLLHLQPAIAAAAGRVGAGRVLDHQPLVPPGPGLGEDALQVVRGRRGGQAAEGEASRVGLGQAQRLQARAALPQGQRQERDGRTPTRPRGEDVEGDVGDGHLGEHRGSGSLATQALLEGQERQHAAVAEGEQLAVEDPVPGEPAGRLDDLRELPRHVVEVAREEAHLVAPAVDLGPDPVVLVLRPDLGSQAANDLRRVLGRRGEHEPQGVEEPQPCLRQTVVAGEEGGLAEVAGEHHGPGDVRRRTPEGQGDRGLHEPLAQPDPQLAAQDLHEVGGAERIAAAEELLEDGRLGGRAPRGLDGGEGGGDLGDGRPAGIVRLARRRRHDVPDRAAQVRVAIVGRPEVGSGDPGDAGHQVRERRPAEAERAGVRLGERPPGEEDDGRAQRRGVDRGEVLGEEACLLRGPRRGSDPLGDLAPPAHGRDGIRSPPWAPGTGFPRRWRGGRSSCGVTTPATSRPSRAGTPTPRWPASPATRTVRCGRTTSGASSRRGWPAPARWPWRSTCGARIA